MAMLISALAVALALSIAACGGGSSGGTEQTSAGTASIKIGAVLSLSGTYAGIGAPEKNVLELEVKKINDAGGINGKQIEIVYADDATDEAKAVAATSKLIDQDGVVAVLGASGSGQTMAMRGDITRAGVPQVSMAGATVITNPVDPLVFATPWSNTIVVPFTLNYIKKQGITRIGLITDAGGFGKDGQAVIKAMAPKDGIKIVADETFNPGDADMTAQLTKIKQSDAQAIVMWTAGAEAATIAKNAQDLAIDLPIYGSHGNARVEFIKGAGTAAEGIMVPAGALLDPTAYGTDTEAYKVTTAFIDSYKAAYNEDPNNFGGYAYDALYLVVNAAKGITGDLTPAALRDAIEKTTGYVGIGGTYTMSATDHNGLTEKDLIMYEIKDGAFTVAK
jgi:branched-chain amino acid transport system substrate-binding protein